MGDAKIGDPDPQPVGQQGRIGLRDVFSERLAAAKHGGEGIAGIRHRPAKPQPRAGDVA